MRVESRDDPTGPGPIKILFQNESLFAIPLSEHNGHMIAQIANVPFNTELRLHDVVVCDDSDHLLAVVTRVYEHAAKLGYVPTRATFDAITACLAEHGCVFEGASVGVLWVNYQSGIDLQVMLGKTFARQGDLWGLP